MAVYGKDELTHRVLDQLRAQSPQVHIYVCDNLGTLRVSMPNVQVLPQPTNLGWAKGTNRAWEAASRAPIPYDGFVLLNNDVILSEGFLEGLWAGAKRTEVGLVGPLYDCRSLYQRIPAVAASDFCGRDLDTDVPYLDGTCILVTRATWEILGRLDEASFGFFGWGVDVDYCIRARNAGRKIAVSHRSYLNHLARSTADSVFPDYKQRALGDYRRGMGKKYGRFWGRHLSFNPVARGAFALRSFANSLNPDFSFGHFQKTVR